MYTGFSYTNVIDTELSLRILNTSNLINKLNINNQTTAKSALKIFYLFYTHKLFRFFQYFFTVFEAFPSDTGVLIEFLLTRHCSIAPIANILKERCLFIYLLHGAVQIKKKSTKLHAVSNYL